jgi:hypothetical protein
MKLKKIIGLALIIAFSSQGCRLGIKSVSSKSPGNESPPSAAKPRNQVLSTDKSLDSTLSEKYGIKMISENIPASTWAELTYKNLQKNDSFLPKYLSFFDNEFNKYSKDFVKITNLKTVAFVKNLAVDGQERAAAPDYYKEILFLDIYLGNYDEQYQRHVIHHEFYHMIEEQLNGDAYYKDPVWASFNPAGFSYGNGGKYERGENAYPVTHPQTGFINIYSASALEEDKAEIYAALFTEGQDKLMKKWIKEGDTVLGKKVNYMKEFLKENKQNVE